MKWPKKLAIMEQLDEFDRNKYRRKNNINHFASLFESEDEEGTKHIMKPKIPIVVLKEEYYGNNKGFRSKGRKRVYQ